MTKFRIAAAGSLAVIAALLVVAACASLSTQGDTEKGKGAISVDKEAVTVNGVSYNMITIPAGDFLMGSALDEPDNFDNDVHCVLSW